MLCSQGLSCCSPLLPAWLRSHKGRCCKQERTKHGFAKSAVSQSANLRQESLPERKDEEEAARSARMRPGRPDGSTCRAAQAWLRPASCCTVGRGCGYAACARLPAEQGAESPGRRKARAWPTEGSRGSTQPGVRLQFQSILPAPVPNFTPASSDVQSLLCQQCWGTHTRGPGSATLPWSPRSLTAALTTEERLRKERRGGPC